MLKRIKSKVLVIYIYMQVESIRRVNLLMLRKVLCGYHPTVLVEEEEEMRRNF